MEYYTVKELLELAEERQTAVSQIVILIEAEETGRTRKEIEEKMARNLKVMRESAFQGRQRGIKSESGLAGGEAFRLERQKGIFSGDIYTEVTTTALAIAGVNAAMGKIVAGPTAGSSGIVPAVILSLGGRLKLAEREILNSLFTAAGLGQIVARKATLAGAAGGCQAECGVASAMAAGAAVELMGGSPEMVGNAFALALKNLLGLVCDPVAGLVEVPCVKRNGFAAAHALTAANMALAGISSAIPPDEVIDALYQIGELLPASLKETSQAGLAVCPTALKISGEIKKKDMNKFKDNTKLELD